MEITNETITIIPIKISQFGKEQVEEKKTIIAAMAILCMLQSKSALSGVV